MDDNTRIAAIFFQISEAYKTASEAMKAGDLEKAKRWFMTAVEMMRPLYESFQMRETTDL